MRKIGLASIENLLEIEKTNSTSGVLPEGKTLEEQIYLTQFKDWDARHAEALSKNKKDFNPLLKIRALLFRGRIDEARDLIQSAKNGAEGLRVMSEILLEEARLASCRGNWGQTAELATEALDHSPTFVTRMTLHQLRSVAYFELQSPGESLIELNRIEAISALLPRGLSGQYARIFKAKIIARDQSPSLANAYIKETWLGFLKSGHLNLDLTLALVRTQIDVLRLEGKPYLNWALASWALSEKIGDELYVALAVTDCYYGATDSTRSALEAPFLSAIKRFERVKDLVHNISTETARTMAEALVKGPREPLDSRFFSRKKKRPALVIPALNTVLHLTPFKVMSVNRPQLFDALKILAPESRAKEDFFRSLWGTQKYVPSIHDTLLRSLAYKVRKLLGLDVSLKEGHLVARDFIYLETR